MYLVLKRGRNMDEVMDSFAEGIKGIAMIIFIVGAGGAFKKLSLIQVRVKRSPQ